MNALEGIRSLVLATGIAVASSGTAHAQEQNTQKVRGIFDLLQEASNAQREQKAKQSAQQQSEIPFPPGDVDKVYELLGREPSEKEMEYLANRWAEIKTNNPLFELDGKNDETLRTLNEKVHNKRHQAYLDEIEKLKQSK